MLNCEKVIGVRHVMLFSGIGNNSCQCYCRYWAQREDVAVGFTD